MFKIINKQILAKDIKRLDIHAPLIAEKALPGQFVSIACDEGDERIALSIIDTDHNRKTITLIVHEVGGLSSKLAGLTLRDEIFSVLGPLGVPTVIEKKGVVVCVATGIGAAQILPIARALKKEGNKVIGIIGAKTKKEILLEAQMRLACSKIFITTNDGSYERRGLATEILREVIEKEDIHETYAIGTPDMMEAVVHMTKPLAIATQVYLNPLMVDCMGMCGSCRVKVGDKIFLACMDGPAFNGHHVDFDHYRHRLDAFKKELWDNQKSTVSPNKSESSTFKKFLADILNG